MALGQLSDESLVERVREGHDEQAFAELVRRHREPVFRLAVSVLGQSFVADAEDVAQDVMVRIHQALPTFRGDAKFGTWVYRIAFNQALNAKARARFRVPHVGDEALEQAASPDRDPHERLQETRRDRAVVDCINDLPEVYQSALRLHYWLGASMSEIATLLDVPENTVKSYLHRARRLLSVMLAERGIDA